MSREGAADGLTATGGARLASEDSVSERSFLTATEEEPETELPSTAVKSVDESGAPRHEVSPTVVVVNENDEDSQDSSHHRRCSGEGSTQPPSCRNCWDTDGNMISPCKCTGTNGLVHKYCLEVWLRQSGFRRCNICGEKFPIVSQLKPLRDIKILPPMDHRVILFLCLTITTLFLVGWLLYGIISTLVTDKSAKQTNLDVTHYTISFVWLSVIIITWIPLFIATRKHLARMYREWLHRNQVLYVNIQSNSNPSSGAASGAHASPGNASSSQRRSLSKKLGLRGPLLVRKKKAKTNATTNTTTTTTTSTKTKRQSKSAVTMTTITAAAPLTRSSSDQLQISHV